MRTFNSFTYFAGLFCQITLPACFAGLFWFYQTSSPFQGKKMIILLWLVSFHFLGATGFCLVCSNRHSPDRNKIRRKGYHPTCKGLPNWPVLTESAMPFQMPFHTPGISTPSCIPVFVSPRCHSATWTKIRALFCRVPMGTQETASASRNQNLNRWDDPTAQQHHKDAIWFSQHQPRRFL